MMHSRNNMRSKTLENYNGSWALRSYDSELRKARGNYSSHRGHILRLLQANSG
jgi:hypothetical protein